MERKSKTLKRRPGSGLQQISENVATYMGLNKREVHDVILIFLEEVKRTLLEGKTVNLTNCMSVKIGTFNVKNHTLVKDGRTETFRLQARMCKALRNEADSNHDKLVRVLADIKKRVFSHKYNKALATFKKKHFEKTGSIESIQSSNK